MLPCSCVAGQEEAGVDSEGMQKHHCIGYVALNAGCRVWPEILLSHGSGDHRVPSSLVSSFLLLVNLAGRVKKMKGDLQQCSPSRLQSC